MNFLRRLRSIFLNFPNMSLVIDPARLANPSPPGQTPRRRLVLGVGRVVVVLDPSPPPRPK